MARPAGGLRPAVRAAVRLDVLLALGTLLVNKPELISSNPELQQGAQHLVLQAAGLLLGVPSLADLRQRIQAACKDAAAIAAASSSHRLYVVRHAVDVLPSSSAASSSSRILGAYMEASSVVQRAAQGRQQWVDESRGRGMSQLQSVLVTTTISLSVVGTGSDAGIARVVLQEFDDELWMAVTTP